MKKLNDCEIELEGRTGISIVPLIQGEGDKVALIPEEALPDELPILALRNAVIFPGTIYPVVIGRKKSIKLIEDAVKHQLLIGTLPQLDVNVEDPREEHLYKFGTVVKIIKTFEMPDGHITAVLQGCNRFQLESVVRYSPYMRAKVHFLSEQEYSKTDADVPVLSDAIKDAAVFSVKSMPVIGNSKETINAIMNIEDFSYLVNFIATTIEIDDFSSKIELLSYADIKSRGLELLKILTKQNELIKYKLEINAKVRAEMDQQQKEWYLNHQLKTIQEELGMDDAEDIEMLKEKAAQKDWPENVRTAFLKEVAKMERYNPSSPDYSIQFNYLQFFIDLPWNTVTTDNLDLNHAKKVLDEDHYGIDSVKDRIIEYLAVLKLKGNMKSPILCLYGPPGVGKTSLGKSIARALGRKYVRIALGGMHDEAEIRGHRKTYIGAMPGRILAGINKAGTSNPVIVLDEIDKIGSDFKGDPSSALLEVLDPEQNTSFHDNYLDQDYDLSKVLFITTANTTSGIQDALLDRMELINVSGYIAEEKAEIAKRFLLPKQLEEHGLGKKGLKIEKSAIDAIVENYTLESGVRGLDKKIAKIARITAKKIAMGEDYPTVIKTSHLKEYLGLPLSNYNKQKGNEGKPGVVTGLAWTSVGGDVLSIESSISSGKGVISMTGNLGNVMKESATIAYQYIKSNPEIAGLTSEEFGQADVHLHVPEGAVPKDGPSAGITIFSSMVSAFKKKPVKEKIAMTGEMTLIGNVLPVGGIKEKILAAKRAGVKTIIISEANRKDIEDIKDIYIKGLSFVYVKTIKDVLNNIF